MVAAIYCRSTKYRKSTYAGYESGYRQPSLEAVKELAILFGTTTDYLLGATDDEQPTIELTNATCHMTVDGKTVTEDEIVWLIAFLRAKRDIEKRNRRTKRLRNDRDIAHQLFHRSIRPI